jgi:hypothetical protein
LLSKCATAARDLSLIRLLAAYIVFTALFLLLTGALNGHLVVHGSMDDAVGFRPILTAIPVLQLWLVVFPLALGAVLLVVFLSPPKDALHARLGVRPAELSMNSTLKLGNATYAHLFRTLNPFNPWRV